MPSSITFSADIAKVIQNLDSNKAHGHDQTSIRMLKICSTSICKPLEIIFHLFLGTGTFPNDWKKVTNVANVYPPISQLPVCGKIFEKLIFDGMPSFLLKAI